MDPFQLEELQLAARNYALPLEALRYPITPLGLHYVLTHYDIPLVDPESWRLEIGGLVKRKLSLSLAELRSRPAVELTVTMECAGNGRAQLSPRPLSQPWLDGAVGTACWKGVPLRELLEAAGVHDEAVEVVFTGLDRGLEAGHEQLFARSLALEQALADGPLLAYEVNGMPLPPQHGYPLRLIVPGWYGMASVKWLASIAPVAEPFGGHQQRVAYRLRQHEDEEGTPLSYMPPRALMVPPGVPDFPERRRTVPVAQCELEGRAWSGHGRVGAVEVSVDGGEWRPAVLEQDVDSPWAWSRWTFMWEPIEAGEVELRCRARDAAGNVQPDEPLWNLGGYANNAVQRVRVTVSAAPRMRT
jgi:DMSO/TMAO reductase YedYZ molybdopterin-dependent catalytic subunit